MEEIDLKEMFSFFIKKIGIIIIVTAGIIALGTVYSVFLKTPMYKSDTSIILGSTSDTSQSITTSDVTLNQNLVDTYTQIIKSRKILTQVIDNLSLELSYEELKDKVSVAALNETEIIQVTVTDEKSENAKIIADEIASVFTKEIWTLYNVNNVSILDTASEAEEPYNINLIKEEIIYFLVGIVLSCGIVFVLFYFDRSIKSVEQIENKTKLPILGSIQMLNKGDRY